MLSATNITVSVCCSTYQVLSKIKHIVSWENALFYPVNKNLWNKTIVLSINAILFPLLEINEHKKSEHHAN